MPAQASTSKAEATPAAESVEIPQRAWQRWRFAKRQEKFWADIAKRERAQLEAMIGDATQATINDHAVISWTYNKDSTTFDVDAFKTEHPKLYAQYLKTKPGARPFKETAHAAEIDSDNESEDDE